MRVLLVPADFHHAEGVMAKNIALHCPDTDFFFFAAHDIQHRDKEFLNLLENVDVVHWVMNLCNIPLLYKFANSPFPCPSVATIHHMDADEEQKLEYAQRCDVIHVESQEWLLHISAITDNPVFLAHNGVTINDCFDGRITRPRSPFRFGTFGFHKSLEDRKRLDILLRALKILRHRNLQFKLVVQGPNWDQLETHFVAEGINVHNRGFVPTGDIYSGYDELDCYLCSSEVEGGPLTVLEALACGVPVVSTSVGLAMEALTIGGGLLVKVNDPEGLATAMQRMLVDRAFYQRCRAETTTVAENFSWKRTGLEYKELYLEAVKAWERNNEQHWLKKLRCDTSPIKQQTTALNYDLFREANLLIKQGNHTAGTLTLMRALLKKDIDLRFKLQQAIRFVYRIFSS